jgi:putative peptide modification system cyclase
VRLRARIGIHVGDVLTWDNTPDDIAKGAKPFEIEGLVKPTTSRLMQLALPGQILLSGIAYQLAHRSQDELGDAAVTTLWRTHGRYRFKGLPDPVAVFEVGEQGIAPLKAPPWSGKAHREVPFWRRPGTMAIEIAVMLALVALPLWYLLRPEPAIAFAQRDWVVVGDLKNLTDEGSFDDSLETAFRIGLEQSRYVNVLSDLKSRDTVKMMQRDPEQTKVDRAIGSEVAIRNGARALILPTVAEIGGRVRVTAEVIDPHTQTTVWSESADGTGVESVLPSLDKINQQLRVRLGEALATVSNESQPLDKVATKNLDALRAYSLARRAYNTGRLREAISLYEQSLRLDSDFALARLDLARTYVSADKESEAREQVSKALSIRARLSSRDALYADAWQATFGPQVAALEKWKALTTLYPDFYAATGAYSYFVWHWANNFDAAIEAARKSAVAQNPHRQVSDYVLGFLYVGKERYPEALDSFRMATNGGAVSRNEYYASAYAAQRQFGKAEEIYAGGHPSEIAADDVDTYITKVTFAADQGKWGASLDQLTTALREAAKIGPEKASRFRSTELSLKALSAPPAEQLAALRSHFQSQTAVLKDDATRTESVFQVLLAGYLSARLDDDKLAQSALTADIPEARDDQHPIPRQMLALVQAEQLRARHKFDQSIAVLKPLLDGTELCIIHQALLDAYAAGGHNEEALVEAAWLADHRGRAYAEYNVQRILLPLNVVQSDLALLRAAEIASDLGRKEQAAKYLSRFRQAWPDAARIDFVAPRLKKVETSLAQTPASTTG